MERRKIHLMLPATVFLTITDGRAQQRNRSRLRYFTPLQHAPRSRRIRITTIPPTPSMASEAPAAVPETPASATAAANTMANTVTNTSTSANTPIVPVQEPQQTDAGDAIQKPVKRSWR